MQFACDDCGIGISTSENNSVLWEHAPCMRSICRGHYYESEEQVLDYYGKLYSNGSMVRVIAQEHTGLLERDEREEVECVFKRGNADHKPWDTNLLLHTRWKWVLILRPLTVVLVICRLHGPVFQRTGLGRKDGNALMIVLANAKPHDLHYADLWR